MSSARAEQHDQAPPPTEPPGGGTAPPGRAHNWVVAAANWAPAVLAAGLMAGLGLWGLARQSSMGNDEVVTRWAALLSLHQLARLLSHLDAVHGLYYLLMHGWMAVGTSPAVMRIPSVIAMAAAVAMTVILGRRLTGSVRAGLFAGLIMAITPSISFYAQTARSYALVMACALAATLVLLRAVRAETAGAGGRRVLGPWAAYAVLLALGGYLNEMFLLVLAAHAVTVALACYGARLWAHWLASAVAATVAVGPLLVISAQQVNAVGTPPRPRLRDVVALFHTYFGWAFAASVLLLVCAAVAVLPPAAARGRRAGPAGETAPGAGPPWWRRGGLSLPSVALPLLIVPAALLMLESSAGRPLYLDRYVLYGEAGAALLAGAGVERIGRALAGLSGRAALIWAPGAAVCLCALLLQLGAQHDVRTPGSRLFDFGGPSRYVAAHARPGDGVLFFTDFYRKAALGYPGDFRDVTDFALAVPPARAGTFQGRDKPFATIQDLMLGHRRIWVVGKPPWAPLPAGLSRAESAVLRAHFALGGEERFKGIMVTLWLRR